MMQQFEQQLQQLFPDEPRCLLKCNLYKKDVLALMPECWLTSECIHLLLEMLGEKYPSGRCRVLDPSIVSMVLFMPYEPILESLKPQQLFTPDYLIVPCNTEEKNPTAGSHWFLLLFDRRERMLWIWDSAYEGGHRNAEVFAKRLKTMYKMFGWEQEQKQHKQLEIQIKRVTKVIKQNNQYDCGVYSIGFAEQIMIEVKELTPEETFNPESLNFDPTLFKCLREKYLCEMINRLNQPT